jgi:inorganic triphosphatase YgiF
METEAKFELLDPNAVSVDTLREIVEAKGFQVECRQGQVVILDTYFDTANFTLRDAGIAIRLREIEGRLKITYKEMVAQHDSVLARVELEGQPDVQLLTNIRNA